MNPSPDIEAKLAEVLQTSWVCNDAAAQRILSEVKFCRTQEDVVGLLIRLGRRIDEIERELRPDRQSRKPTSVAQDSRINIRL